MGEVLYTLLWIGVLILVVMVGCYIIYVLNKITDGYLLDWSMPDTISG